jgi:hypothetical protein
MSKLGQRPVVCIPALLVKNTANAPRADRNFQNSSLYVFEIKIGILLVFESQYA